MPDQDAKSDYIRAIAERFHGRFEKVINQYSVLYNDEEAFKKPMQEDAVIAVFLKILELKKTSIIRPAAMWEALTNKSNYIKIEFDITHNNKTIVKKTELCDPPTWDEKSDIILKENKFYIKLKEQSKTEKNDKSNIDGFIVIDIDSFKNHDEVYEVFRTELGRLILVYYNFYFYKTFLVCNNTYSALKKALFQTDLYSIEQHAKQFIDELEKVEGNLTSSQFSRWIKMECEGSGLEQMIGKDECDTMLGAELDTDMVKLRKKIWKKHKESEVFEEKEIPSYIEQINKWDYPSELKIPFKLFKEDKNNFQHVPEEIIDPVIDFSIKNRFRIEYFRTILFAINIIGLTAEREASVTVDQVKFIQDLWKDKLKKTAHLHDFIKKYLKLWKLDKSSESEHEKSIVITQEWLMAWFALQLINSESKTFAAYKDNKFGPRKTIRFYRHLSTIFLYLLYWIRKYGSTNYTPFSDVENGYEAFLQSLIYLISEYAYNDGGLTRNADICRALRYMWSHQSILYTVSESYRDHLHHVLETCLMGLFFLRLNKKKQHCFFGIFDNKLNEQQLIRNWIITALFHDVGYGVGILRHQLDHLSFFETGVIVELREEIDKKLNELEKKLCMDSLDCLKKYLSHTKAEAFQDLKRFDHGVLSALQIACLVEKPDKEWWLDINMAIEAAALHNYNKAKIDHNKAPLAFLLFLCDHLQEWDRPYIEGEQMRYSLLVNLVRPNINKSYKNESMVKYLILKDTYLDNELNPVLYKKIEQLTFGLHFVPAEKMQYHPPLAWVGHCMDFQRIGNCNLPIIIQLNHPLSSSEQCDMDLFDDFLDESGRSGPDRKLCGKKEIGNSVLREWIQTARDQSSWFKYDKKKHEEQMTIELQKIDGKVYIPSFPTMLVKHYIDWAERCRKGYYTPPRLTSFNL